MSITTPKRKLHALIIAALPLLAVGCAHTGGGEPAAVSPLVESGPALAPQLQESETQTVATYEQSEPLAEQGPVSNKESAASDKSEPETSTVGEVMLPEQRIFQFGFDKSEVSEADLAAIMKHAQYLEANPQLTLLISGHADNRGPKEYNSYLSAQRAKSIAALLIEAGVDESRLRVIGKGDSEPLLDAEQWRENRRVELDYEDNVLVGNP